MQDILTALATEGMTLARDVTTPEGTTLCGKGTKLTESLISRLKKMEINHIAVEGRPVRLEGEKTQKEEFDDIEKRFSKVTDTPPLMYLKKKVIERMIASWRS